MCDFERRTLVGWDGSIGVDEGSYLTSLLELDRAGKRGGGSKVSARGVNGRDGGDGPRANEVVVESLWTIFVHVTILLWLCF